MGDDESTLLVPLRSNASALLTGAPIAAVRRRLKVASLVFDKVLLEGGLLHVFAGSRGASSMVTYPKNVSGYRWQTPMERRVGTQSGFSVSLGSEQLPGVPAEQLRQFINSDAAIAWEATLVPFVKELPPDCDWIEVVSYQVTSPAKKLASSWSKTDEKNQSLKESLPVQFVRSQVIKNANLDMAFAAQSGMAVSMDSMHRKIVAQRFMDDVGWRFLGFAVPILLPRVIDLPWESVADIRKSGHMSRFRAVMREIEDEVRNIYEDGDVERIVHHVFERYQSRILGEVEGLGASVKRAVEGMVIGGAAGVATMGIVGLGGLIAGTGLGAAPTAVMDATKVLRRKRDRGWVSVYNRIAGMD